MLSAMHRESWSNFSSLMKSVCQRKMCQYSASKSGFLPHCAATDAVSMQVMKPQVFVMAGFVLIAVELN